LAWASATSIFATDLFRICASILNCLVKKFLLQTHETRPIGLVDASARDKNRADAALQGCLMCRFFFARPDIIIRLNNEPKLVTRNRTELFLIEILDDVFDSYPGSCQQWLVHQVGRHHLHQSWTTSSVRRVATARQSDWSIELDASLTLPSHSSTMTPPGCMLRAAESAFCC
jgi:hypothetical protein